MKQKYGSQHGSTKTAAVVRALRRSTGLTTAGAFELGECHLASTVLRLRRAGVVVQDEWRIGVSRYNKIVRFKLYRIAH